MNVPSFSLIIPAAGTGTRMGTEIPKPYLDLMGKTVLERTLSCFAGLENLQQVIVSTSDPFRDQTFEIVERLFENTDKIVVEGGRRRQDSIYNALLQVGESVELVAVHDAVRPFIKRDIVRSCLKMAEEVGGAIIGVPVKDTIKQVNAAGIIDKTPDRSQMWQAQTPQIFKKNVFIEAYRYANIQNTAVTDDASLFEAFGRDVQIVEGERDNFKLTYPIDFKIAEMLIESFKP